jgi:hypothetical protein
MRVTVENMQRFVEAYEDLEDAIAAMRDWLDAKDGDDREAIADARADLVPALGPAGVAVSKLNVLVGGN